MKTHQTNKTPAQTNPKDLQVLLTQQQPEPAHFNNMLREMLTSKAPIGDKREQMDAWLAHAQLEVGEPRKVALLEVALQAGVSDGNNCADNSHKILVSKTLQQIAKLHTTPTQQSPIDKLDLSQTSNDMFEHLTYARRFLTLYPPAGTASAKAEPSNLQEALRTQFDNPCPESKQNAEQTLKDETAALGHTGDAEPDSFDMWKTAQEKNNLDIQRAVLLLYPNEIDFVSAKTRKEMPDPAMKKVLKEIPYQSRRCRDVSVQYMNSHASFIDDPDESIFCRHLAIHRIETQAGHVKGKFRVMHNEKLENHLPTIDAISEHVHLRTEEQSRRIQVGAIETHLIHHADFGKTLIGQFKNMGVRNESVRHIFLASTDHAMSLQLHIKNGTHGAKQYVVQFYDPNMTTDHIRVANTELNALHSMSLMDLFKQPNYKGHYNDYFLENDDLAALYVGGNSAQTLKILNDEAALEPDAMKNRKLTIDIERTQVTSTVLWYLLAGGFGDTLRELTPTIEQKIMSLPENERAQLLTASEKRGFTGLHTALRYGHADAIRAFGPLLELLPDAQERTKLVAARDKNGIPGFAVALIEGHLETIEAFGELLDKVPENERAILLATVGDNHASTLHAPLRNGEADIIKRFATLLDKVPENERAELLAARNEGGIPGLSLALFQGHVEAIEAFGELLAKVPDRQDRVELLLSLDKNGTSGYDLAVQKGRTEAVAVMHELIQRFG